MNKGLMYLLITVGGLVGGWIPVLFGTSTFSAWSIVGSTIGGFAGIYAAYKLC